MRGGKTAEEVDGERERTAEGKEDQKKERAGGEERMETCQEARGREWMDVDRSHTQSKSQTGFPQRHCHVDPEPNKNQERTSPSPT